MANLVLRDGPFDGELVGIVEPDQVPPAQVVWSGWSPQGFTAWLYEWRGERTMTLLGSTYALIYRPTGRQLAADDIPPAVGEAVEMWVDSADRIVEAFDVPHELIWPGL